MVAPDAQGNCKGDGTMSRLSVSLVTFHPDRPMLQETLSSLRMAVDQARQAGLLGQVALALVDNGDDAGLPDIADAQGWQGAQIIRGQGNVGFGCGHNLAILQEMGDLHLVLNPDVYIQPDALINALTFMSAHPECVLLSPAIIDAGADWNFLCKRLPSVFDLFLRGFAPRGVRQCFARRMALYELADVGRPDVLWDPPIASGCFMLFRAETLRKLQGFDPRFFLYFEDFDLSLRAASLGRLAAVASVRIAHHGGGAGRKGLRHVLMFGRSARLFFATHGWRWW
jgi:GT2 family glycosyltransferase